MKHYLSIIMVSDYRQNVRLFKNKNAVVIGGFFGYAKIGRESGIFRINKLPLSFSKTPHINSYGADKWVIQRNGTISFYSSYEEYLIACNA